MISFISVAFVERRKPRRRMSARMPTAASDRPADAVASKAEERRAIGVACGAHALHDGYTDLIYVMLPIWQAEFGLGYAALGLLRTCYSGTMAGLQIPSGAAVRAARRAAGARGRHRARRASAIWSPAPASASGRWWSRC